MRRTFLVWFWASSVGLSQLTGCNLVEKVVKRITGGSDPEPASTEVAPPGSALPEATAPAISVTTPVPSAAVPVVVPAALNSARVKRFADEKAIEPAEAQVAAANVAVQEDPDAPSAVPLATLEQQAKVFKVAERGEQVLVTFEDPKVKAQFLQGWLPTQALDAAAAANPSATATASASAPSATAPSASAPDPALPPPPGTNKVKPKAPPAKSSPPAKSAPPAKTTPPPAESTPKKKKKKKVGEKL